jgi:glycosyltransferase involved in cell wall biosynthesis
MIWLYWISGTLLATLWSISVIQSAIHAHELADLTRPEWEVPDGTALPSLTIVVPARNEEADVGPALESLLRLNYPAYDVVAVNDRSTDRTGEIMERIAATAPDNMLKILHVKKLPPQWLGKAHAMWLAARQTESEWILFTDADCVFHPESMRRALNYARKNKIDHLVLFPDMHMQTWGEQMMISFPAVMGGFGFHRYWKIKDPNAKDHIGVGAFNLIRRQAYDAVGSYEKLRMEIVDDLKLGEAVKQAGLRQDVVFGPELVRLRWGRGAAGIIRNLEKNIFAFLKYRISLVLLLCFVLFFLAVWPFAGLALASGWARAGFAVAVAMIAASYLGVSRHMETSPLLFFLCPISAVLLMVATLRSAFLALRDNAVTWRGTKYSLEELRRGS